MAETGVLVIGGGISGLTCAFRLSERQVPVVLLEAAARPGGVIDTEADSGWLTEFGPNTITTTEPALTALVHDLGLDSELLTADRAGARRYVVRGGRPLPLPMSAPTLIRSPLFSAAAKWRLAAEPFIPRGPAATGVDESVAAFVRRRLGREFLDYAAGPFVSGIYAGDPERLSVRHALPKLAALEASAGSLISGAIKARRAGTTPAGANRLISFRDGLAALPRRLAARLGPGYLGGMAVTRLESMGRLWRAHAIRRDGTDMVYDAPRVVLAVDARTTARLLDAPGLATLPHAGVRMAGLGFRRADVGHPLDGFGLLVPRVEAFRLLGALFTSTLFPGRAPEGHVAITAIAGGATDPAILSLDPDEFLATIVSELSRLLDIRGRPVRAVLRSWPEALPQYELGHERYLDLADELERRPGLHLLGSWRGGVAVPDRIRRAGELAARLAAP